MSNLTADLVANLNAATFWINRILPPVQIAFGSFGNVFNILIFTRRSLRTNPCSLYFLAGSVNNLFVIYVALLTRYLASSWNIDPSAMSTVLCKLRNFFIYPSLGLVLWLPTLASIDRFLSSSHNVRHRQLSSLPIARKLIVFTTILVFLSYVHILVLYRSDWTGTAMTCTLFWADYLVFFNFFVPIVFSILPVVTMAIFGVLTILNVRSIRNRIAPQNDNAQNERLRSSDRQLIKMLLFQVLTLSLLTAPWSIICMYSVIALTLLNYKLSTFDQAIYNVAYNLFRLLYYTDPVVAFYIYTLTGPKFRVEMKRCNQYALEFMLTAIGLERCLPLRVQQVLLDDNQMHTNNVSLTAKRKGNTVHPIQHKNTVNRTLAV